MRNKAVIIFIGALLSVAAGVFFLSEDLVTPYLPFEDVKASPGKYVQIIGKPEHTKQMKSGPESFRFILNDGKGGSIEVVSREAKPMNFEHAEQAVVLGRYDAAAKVFSADRILVKCPSKYERKK